MANRMFDMVSFQMEKNVVRLYAKVTIGATGAPTLLVNSSKGVLSITRVSAGKYTVVFGTNSRSLDTYAHLLNASVLFDTSAISGVAPAAATAYLTADAVQTTASLTFQCDNLSGTATDPANGEILRIAVELGNSTAY
jgi:hypothetical protein